MIRPFRLDKRNAMLLGVCSGIANSTGIDVTLVRLGVIVATVFGAFPWTLIAYGVAAWVAKPLDGLGAIDRQAMRAAARSEASDIDRRLAELERQATSSSSALAREIEQLR